MDVTQSRVWDETFRLSLNADSEPRLYYPYLFRLAKGEARITRTLRQGNVLNPVLIELPTAPCQFVHPLSLPNEYSDVAHQSACRDRRLMLKILVGYLMISAIGALILPDIRHPLLQMSAICLFLSAYCWWDYRSTFVAKNHLHERCRYYGWLFTSSRIYVFLTIFIFLVVACLQFGFGDERFLAHYGLLFDLPDGQWWRIVSGGFIHTGPAHWITNLGVGIAIAAMTGPALRFQFLPVWLVGSVCASALTFLWYQQFPNPDHMGLVGTSGGLAALLGAQLMLCTRYPQSYPRGFFVTVSFFVIVTLFLAAIVTSQTSMACHSFGLLTGFFMGAFIPDHLVIND